MLLPPLEANRSFQRSKKYSKRLVSSWREAEKNGESGVWASSLLSSKKDQRDIYESIIDRLEDSLREWHHTWPSLGPCQLGAEFYSFDHQRDAT
jgi:hypothetical protein